MTDPSQYFKGRTVHEQMNEVIGYVDTRAAEVATDAIAADVAQVHQDMLDADADATAAAASAAAAAGTLANAVKKTGEASQSIAGDVAVAGALSGGSLGTSGNLSVGGTGAFTGAVTGPTEATGTFSTKLATSDKVKNELDNYAPMVRTANNQTIGGTKSFSTTIVRATTIPGTVTGYTPANGLEIRDVNSKALAFMNTAKGATYVSAGIEARSNVNNTYYSKLFIRVADTGKVDLILESQTSQGYEQHVIYTFGS